VLEAQDTDRTVPNTSTTRSWCNRFSAKMDVFPFLSDASFGRPCPHAMGNGLSVSSAVDDLHALKPEERSKALDNLCVKVCSRDEASKSAEYSTSTRISRDI
jgi:hypothetical protein